MPGQRLAFWAAVALVSMIAPAAANAAADSKLGDVVPGFRTANNYITRRNG